MHDEGRGEAGDAAPPGTFSSGATASSLVLAGFGFGSRMALEACDGARRLILAGYPTVYERHAALLRCPLLRIFIHSTRDEFGPREELERLYGRLWGPKQLHWIEAGTTSSRARSTSSKRPSAASAHRRKSARLGVMRDAEPAARLTRRACLGAVALPLLAARPPMERLPGSGIRIGLNVCSFNEPLRRSSAAALFGAVRFCARHRIAGIDDDRLLLPRAVSARPPEGSSRRLKGEAFLHGVTIFGTGVTQ